MLNHIRVVTTLLLFAIAVTAIAKPMKTPGLDSAVKVIRDVDGIPHIIGNSEHDVVFVQGYLHAQDRFFQMDLLRRQAAGEFSEIFG